MDTNHIATVHLIFKTHLDLGFTDLAQNVVAQYFDVYIPSALDTAQQLREAGGVERFIWTTGAWLIYEYLEQASPEQRRRMEAAIDAGDIVWHGLPFTTHSELMDASLFQYGLTLSRQLDQRFGKQTIAAKMTDVPGHTRAIVPLLAEAGIQFLHIGVNGASTAPDVPPLFVWRDGSGADLMVMYQHAYGGLAMMPGMSEAMVIAHTSDNIGPQMAEQVVDIFAALREQFPQAKVVASTLDACARDLMRAKPDLPVITEEIGDTWIHGVGSDPTKIRRFRELCRLRSQWLRQHRATLDDAAFARFSRFLLLVPEHTWGLDEKTHLADDANYRRQQFDVVREQANYIKLESSWAEQRAYLDQAIQVLGDSPLADEARDRLEAIEPAVPSLTGFKPVSVVSQLFDTAHFALRFDASFGSIVFLEEKNTQRLWASNHRSLGLLRYQTFSQADYDRYLDQYLTRKPEWALLDFGKPGIAEAGSQSKWWYPLVYRMVARVDDQGHHFILGMAMSEAASTRHGCPRRFTLQIDVPSDESAIYFDLQWFEKPASRLPEALWFSFCPLVTDASGWMMDKMGRHISPLNVVSRGNRKLHAVGKGIVYQDFEGKLAIETLDAPLLAPGEPSLLNFDNEPPALEHGMHFNLYNNVWGTNFPMWYGEDARFRFVLRIN